MKLEMNCPRCGKLMRVDCKSKAEFTLTCDNCGKPSTKKGGAK